MSAGAGALAFPAGGLVGSGPAQADPITSPASHTILTGPIAAILARLENLTPQSSNQMSQVFSPRRRGQETLPWRGGAALLRSRV